MNHMLANTPGSRTVIREKEWHVKRIFRSGYEITLTSSSGELQELGSLTKMHPLNFSFKRDKVCHFDRKQQ